MAIVKMQKISFYGLTSQREAALSYLMKKGVMQIDDAAALAEEEEISSIVFKDVRKDQARKYERRKNAAFSAMTGLKQLTGFKKGLFAQKHERAKPSYDEARGIYQKAKKVNADFHELDNLKARQTSLENEMQALAPWRGFDGDLGTAQTKTVRMLLGHPTQNCYPGSSFRGPGGAGPLCGVCGSGAGRGGGLRRALRPQKLL